MLDLICVYDKTIYRNELNGYSVFTVHSKEHSEYLSKYGNIVCAGKIAVYVKGMPLKLSGEFIKTKDTYTFSVSDASEYSDDINVAVSFIIDSEIPGIGPKTAEKIVQITGPDIFDFIKQSNAQETLLEKVQGLSSNSAHELVVRIRESMTEKEIYDFIFPFGGNFNNAANISEKYGCNSLKKLKNNPYGIGIDAGMRFATCDAIAQSIGKHFYDEDRIESLFVCALRALASNGHIYSEIQDVYDCIMTVVKHSAFHEEIPAELLIRAAYKSKKINIECKAKPLYSLTSLRKTEIDIVNNLKRITNSSVKLLYSSDIVADTERLLNISYSDKQKESFNFLSSTGVKILTGGPGTGKTTVINGLIHAYKQMYPSNTVTLCAPTGRAAQRLSESTNMSASTIHRLLNIKPCGDDITYRDQSNPIESDFLIIDEMSMTDETVFDMIIGAVKNGTLVLLCGDVDQLPSVGPGNILKDLINSGQFEVNKLDVVYRQLNDSTIVSNALKINQGNTDLKCDKSFEIIKVDTVEEIAENVKNIMRSYYSRSLPFETQVLTSVKKDEAGVYNLNNLLQEIVNPGDPNIGFGITRYRINDKVMMVKNNYELKYVNGDLGTIKDINEKDIIIELTDKEICLPKKYLQDMMLAYAATVHKSQGSEYGTVIIALPERPHNMLKRNILYTAVTRAKSNVIIIAQGNALETAIHNTDNSNRRTMLSERLQKI